MLSAYGKYTLDQSGPLETKEVVHHQGEGERAKSGVQMKALSGRTTSNIRLSLCQIESLHTLAMNHETSLSKWTKWRASLG
jgi:hypothetical protein